MFFSLISTPHGKNGGQKQNAQGNIQASQSDWYGQNVATKTRQTTPSP
ncbi:MAG: hypothetical protein VX646_11100 [Verrucomicrobiota bacterium]|nr:hypothetical protein [Verrucomicrobiota bacterium]